MRINYQIFRKLPDNRFVWVESVEELQEARNRILTLGGDHVLFDPRERTIIGRSFSSAA